VPGGEDGGLSGDDDGMHAIGGGHVDEAFVQRVEQRQREGVARGRRVEDKAHRAPVVQRLAEHEVAAR